MNVLQAIILTKVVLAWPTAELGFLARSNYVPRIRLALNMLMKQKTTKVRARKPRLSPHPSRILKGLAAECLRLCQIIYLGPGACSITILLASSRQQCYNFYLTTLIVLSSIKSFLSVYVLNDTITFSLGTLSSNNSCLHYMTWNYIFLRV